MTRRAVFAIGVTAAASVAVMRAPAKAAEFEWKCASTIPGEHPSMVTLKQMWSAVARESGGRLHVENFADGQLGGDPATLAQMRLGAIQFYVGMANLAAIVPAIGVHQVGFAFKDEAQALRAMDGEFGAYLNRESQAKGLFILPRVFGNGMRDITLTPRAIRAPDDLNGLKLRIPNSAIVADFFKLLGTTPVNLTYADVYPALQTKIIDGQESPLAAMEGAKLFEVQRYLSLTHHGWTGAAIVTTVQTWNSLPPDLRAVVERNCIKYAVPERRSVAAYTAAVADKFARRGLAVNRVDSAAFRARIGSYYAHWAKEFGPTAWGLLESAVGQKLG
jgi:tripartite ATP-independent transporter DctP family solute receptor